MGKRSSFKRRKRDRYDTPAEPVEPLLPHLDPRVCVFCEPCAGRGDLIRHLSAAGHRCVEAWDIRPRAGGITAADATQARAVTARVYITNPPWTRDVLHAIIDNLAAHLPTWLLLDADWMHTEQADGYWQRCTKIVSIGRVRWIPGSAHDGKDNCCWYLFEPGHTGGPQFVGRS